MCCGRQTLGIHNHSQSQSGVSGLLWLSSWFKSSARLHSSQITQQVFDSLSFVAPGKPIRILKSPASHCNFKIIHVKECLCKYNILISIYPNSILTQSTNSRLCLVQKYSHFILGSAWCLFEKSLRPLHIMLFTLHENYSHDKPVGGKKEHEAIFPWWRCT